MPSPAVKMQQSSSLRRPPERKRTDVDQLLGVDKLELLLNLLLDLLLALLHVWSRSRSDRRGGQRTASARSEVKGSSEGGQSGAVHVAGLLLWPESWLESELATNLLPRA